MKKFFTLIMMAVMTLPMFAAETVLWSGNQEFPDDWKHYIQIDKAKFANAKAGDVLNIHVTALTVGGQIYMQKGNWKNFDPELNMVFSEEAGDEAPETVKFPVTKDFLDSINTTGALIVKGKQYTCDKIYLSNDDPEPTTEEIDLTQPMGSAWDSSYDPETKTITWTNAEGKTYSWGGCGWWYGDDSESGSASKDCSGYTKITYEFAGATTASGGLEFQYVSGDAGWTGFDAGATSVEYNLDATRSANVKAIYLKLAEAGSITLKRVYFTKSTTPTGISNYAATMAQPLNNHKFLENGKIVIVNNNQKFSVNGQLIK